MKVALVYDRVNKFGGAERVMLDLHKIYPAAPIYTLVYNPKKAQWAKDIKVIPSYFNKLNFLRDRHDLLAPVAAMAFETFNFDGYDVVISVSSADAKAIITKPSTLHINYCLTPTRYLWSGAKEYRSRVWTKSLFDYYLKYAHAADLVFSSRPDSYIAISREVKKRIKQYYQHDSEVIYPAIDYDFWSQPKSTEGEDYYLVVSRLVPYKKTDLIIRAFNKLKRRLIVVGNGSQLSQLKELAKKNISFVESPDDALLRQLYAGARALIFPQLEDFGLVPLEAMAAGTPVLAYAAGGALETVIDMQTGLFFKDQTAAAIINTVNSFEAGRHQITRQNCQKQASQFSQSGFMGCFSAKVNMLWQEYQTKNTL